MQWKNKEVSILTNAAFNFVCTIRKSSSPQAWLSMMPAFVSLSTSIKRKFCLLTLLKRKLAFDIESLLFRRNLCLFISTFSSSYMSCMLSWCSIMFSIKDNCWTVTMSFLYVCCICLTYLSKYVTNRLWYSCKSNPPSRRFLLLGGITCTISAATFCNFGLSASFISSSLSNSGIGLVLSSYPNAVDNSSKL